VSCANGAEGDDLSVVVFGDVGTAIDSLWTSIPMASVLDCGMADLHVRGGSCMVSCTRRLWLLASSPACCTGGQPTPRKSLCLAGMDEGVAGSIRLHQALGFPLEGVPNAEGVPVVKDYGGPGVDRVVFAKSLEGAG
jgi:hypothetical protein